MLTDPPIEISTFCVDFDFDVSEAPDCVVAQHVGRFSKWNQSGGRRRYNISV